VLSYTLAACAMVVLGLSQSPHRIAVATLAVGFFTDMSRPAVTALIADVVPPADRPRAFAMLYWAFNLGFSIAPVIAGFVASFSYQVLFIADAVTTLACALLVFLRVPETRPSEAAGVPRRGGLSGLSVPLRDGTFLLFVFLTFAMWTLTFQFQVALPVDIVAKGNSEATYGRVIAINGILIVLLQPIVGPLLQRFRRSSVMAMAAVLTGVGFGLPAVMPSLAGFVLGIVIWTLGEILIAPMTPSVVADLSPPTLRGSYQGVLFMSTGGAQMLGPIIGGAVYARFGADTLWAGCFFAGLVIAGGHLLIAPMRRKKMVLLRVERSTHVSLAED
jgi:MFS family permease